MSTLWLNDYGDGYRYIYWTIDIHSSNNSQNMNAHAIVGIAITTDECEKIFYFLCRSDDAYHHHRALVLLQSQSSEKLIHTQ